MGMNLTCVVPGCLMDGFDAAEVADCMPDDPNVWSDGSCVTDDLAGIAVAGAGAFSTETGYGLVFPHLGAFG